MYRLSSKIPYSFEGLVRNDRALRVGSARITEMAAAETSLVSASAPNSRQLAAVHAGPSTLTRVAWAMCWVLVNRLQLDDRAPVQAMLLWSCRP